jgi:tetratricopeptide (TPR) repeat protein
LSTRDFSSNPPLAVEAIKLTQAHRKGIIAAVVGAIVLAAIVLGVYAYMQNQNEKAASALGHAISVMSAPVRQPGQPEIPNALSFASQADLTKAALGELEGVADKYPHADAGHYALYLAGGVQAESGDIAGAEKTFQRAGESGGDAGSLAKLALANLYNGQKRDADAVKLYRELADHPTQAVPKTTAQLQLAELYEDRGQKLDAVKIYEQMQKDNSKSQIGQMAQQKITALQGGK